VILVFSVYLRKLQTEVYATFPKVNAVSRTRFQLGRITETQRSECRTIQYRKPSRTYFKKPKTHLLLRLQIEMRRQVQFQTLALIETTANPKRCPFALSSRNSEMFEAQAL